MTTKYDTLHPWLDEILTAIKRDIKVDYLPKDPSFCRSHFGTKPLNRLTAEEINAAFSKELRAGNQEMSEWVVNRWVFKHGDIYRHFAERLAPIHSDFSEIKTLTVEQSDAVLAGAVEAFGVKTVYFFSVLNDVVFPESIFMRLRKMTEAAEIKEKADAAQAQEQMELSKLIERQQKEISRLTEKYEQKLEGVLKKYMADTESLKKQVRALQQRVS